MQVLKFGGSSLENASHIRKSVAIVMEKAHDGKVVMVVSALGGITDLLIETARLAEAGNETYLERLKAIEVRHLQVAKELMPMAHQSRLLSQVKIKCNEIEKICEGIFLLRELSPRALDSLTGYGELLSSLLVSGMLEGMKIEHKWLDGRKLIRTDSHYSSAAVNFDISGRQIREQICGNEHSLFIVPGFIAADQAGLSTTLGRGGSDYSASIIAAAVQAKSLEIWTDVNGMMTADPRLVSQAKTITRISYREAMELSHFGAKVIYPPTIQPVMQCNIPIVVRNTFAPEEAGTLIERNVFSSEPVRGLSSIGAIALLSLEGSGMAGVPGISKRLFEALSQEKISVIFITQSSSEYSICVAVEAKQWGQAKQAIDTMFEQEIKLEKISPLLVELDLAIVALVGDRMRNKPGISGKMFSALGRNGVNIRAIAQGSSEMNITAVISTPDLKKAINVLHEEFFESASRQVNLFVVGLGNVGRRLMEQIQLQCNGIQSALHIQLRVMGLANSRTMVFSEKGIDLAQWEKTLEKGKRMNLQSFMAEIKDKNLRNSVFVDVTASGAVAKVYASLLKSSISIVACNKIACSSAYSDYLELKHLSGGFKASFLYETNVGASLPVIGTLNDLVRSGDQIKKIEAVLSGTLNFVFNEYNGSRSFAEIVKQAQAEGYTEPDPRTDLSGTDVMRKILILAREAGFEMEATDIANSPFLPLSCLKGTVADFYIELEKHEPHFKKLYLDAKKAGCILKFVATMQDGKGHIGLKHIKPSSDLYHLYGKDNVVVFYTHRYNLQPLVIKGAGAGAEVTASGIFGDIIRTAGVR
jgi:aspartokinase/homoserine dehydrogenase 1